MKNTIRRVARSLARIPLFGRLVHILAAMYRLPLIRAQLEHLNLVAHQQHDALRHDEHLLNAEVFPALQRIETGYSRHLPPLLDTVKRHEAFYKEELPSLLDTVKRLETGYKEQLPSLLDAISDINERQRILDVDHQNLTKSAPIELRALRRDVISLGDKLAEIRHVAGLVDALKGELSEVQDRLGQEQIEQREAAMALRSSVDVLEKRLDSSEKEYTSLFEDMPRSLRSLKQDIKSVSGTLEGPESFGERIEALAQQVAELKTWHSDAMLAQTNEVKDELELLTNQVRDLDSWRSGIAQAEVGEVKDELESLANQVRDLDSWRSDIAQAEVGEVKEKLKLLDAQLGTIEHNMGGEEAQRRAQGRLDSLEHENGKIWNRLEFIRRELMFEMRYGGGQDVRGNARTESLPKIIEPDIVDVARKSGLRLNVGCGHIQPEGYVNVDLRELPGIHILAEAGRLPFGPEEIQEIYAAHLLEHFPEEQLRRRILPHWSNLLVKGGELRVVVPDAEAMIKNYVAGTYPYDDLREVIYGAQDYDGDFHYNMFTPEHLVRLLSEAGLEDVVLVESGRQNGRCYEFELRARRPNPE